MSASRQRNAEHPGAAAACGGIPVGDAARGGRRRLPGDPRKPETDIQQHHFLACTPPWLLRKHELRQVAKTGFGGLRLGGRIQAFSARPGSPRLGVDAADRAAASEAPNPAGVSGSRRAVGPGNAGGRRQRGSRASASRQSRPSPGTRVSSKRAATTSWRDSPCARAAAAASRRSSVPRAAPPVLPESAAVGGAAGEPRATPRALPSGCGRPPAGRARPSPRWPSIRCGRRARPSARVPGPPPTVNVCALHRQLTALPTSHRAIGRCPRDASGGADRS